MSAALSTFGEVLPDRRGPDEGKLLSERAFGNIMAARPEVALIACRQDHWGRVGDHPNRRLHETVAPQTLVSSAFRTGFCTCLRKWGRLRTMAPSPPE